MVKNTIKKMHGLNTVQFMENLQLPQGAIYNGNIEEDPISAHWFHICPDSPDQLFSRQILLSSTPNRQFYFKRCYSTVSLTSMMPFNVYMQVIRLRVRHDIPNDYQGGNPGKFGEYTTIKYLSEIAAPLSIVPFGSMTSGNLFQKNFKILSNKVKIFRPGATKRITVKRRFGARPLTWSQDGDNNRAMFREGNQIAIVRFWGVPFYPRPQVPADNYCETTPYMITGIEHGFYSYYNMDDAVPTTTVQDSLAALRESTLEATMPTPCNLTTMGGINANYVPCDIRIPRNGSDLNAVNVRQDP